MPVESLRDLIEVYDREILMTDREVRTALAGHRDLKKVHTSTPSPEPAHQLSAWASKHAPVPAVVKVVRPRFAAGAPLRRDR